MKKAIKGRGQFRFKNLLKKFFLKLRGIAVRLFFLNHVLSRREKIILATAFIIFIITGTAKAVAFYHSITKEVPTLGGVYCEAVIGQPEFINPVLARSDNDKTVTNLIYKGLVSLDDQNQITPELATSWEISADQKVYTFHLRQNVSWHDDQLFDADDVVYTYQMIADPSQKSPLYANFKDVLVEKVDQATVRFTLKTPYGPFFTNLNVGIIPANRSLTELNNRPVGTGQYHYVNAATKGNLVDKMILEANDRFYGDQPFVKRIEFKYVPNQTEAKNLFEQEDVSAVTFASSRVNAQTFSYQTPAKIMLFLNLRTAPFNNKDIRKTLQKNQNMAQELKFDVLVADTPELVKEADGLKEKISSLGFKANVMALKESDLKERIAAKDFQAMVIGVDFGHDFDPYSLWHSSQESGMNLAGFNVKAADIILEDARTLADPKARQAKYEEFQKILDEEAPAVVLSDRTFSFAVDNRVKEANVAGALTASEHLKNISKWYIDTKRVRK